MVLLLAAPIASFAIMDTAAVGGWLSARELSAPLLRCGIAVIPTGLIAWGSTFKDEPSRRWLGVALLSVFLGASVIWFLPSRPIGSAVFDESHGKWETISAKFGPDDFGRGSNYTYSLLSAYSERLFGKSGGFYSEEQGLPDEDALFVVKVPTNPLSKGFIEKVEGWVKAGGRLLIVADHTDLYDSSQNLAPLLQRFGAKVLSDAVYDANGMPNVPRTALSMFVLGRIDADDIPLPWQTGSSFSEIPINIVALASYGASFSEPGDYSRPNRFGPFSPRPTHRFGDHTAVGAIAVGRGAVVIILDSTPWSNFSLFRNAYPKLFRSIAHALSQPITLYLAGWSGMLLLAVTILFVLYPSRPLLVAAGLVLGLAIGTHAKIGSASFDQSVEGRDYTIRTVVGKSAKFEFLKQLIRPGSRNFSRIVSSLAKYGLLASASTPGEEIPELDVAKKWLLIQPDPRQFPEAESVFSHLRDGRDLTVLFGPESSTDPDVIEWLSHLGLYQTRSLGLALAEDRLSQNDGLITRRGPMLLRDVRTSTVALPTMRTSPQLPSPAENLIGYLTDLQERATAFVSTVCPKIETVTTCRERFLAPDLTEWMVSWTASPDGGVSAIELLHERRFSGLGNTWNILFAE